MTDNNQQVVEHKSEPVHFEQPTQPAVHTQDRQPGTALAEHVFDAMRHGDPIDGSVKPGTPKTEVADIPGKTGRPSAFKSLLKAPMGVVNFFSTFNSMHQALEQADLMQSVQSIGYAVQMFIGSFNPLAMLATSALSSSSGQIKSR